MPGEDPSLTSEYVRQFCHGLQHGDPAASAPGPAAVGDDQLQVISTCKHFLGYDIEYVATRLNRPLATREQDIDGRDCLIFTHVSVAAYLCLLQLCTRYKIHLFAWVGTTG